MNKGKLQHTFTIEELKQHYFCRVYLTGDLILHFAIEKKTGKTVYIIDSADFRDAIQDGILELKFETRDVDYFEYNENHKQENTI